MTISEIEGVSTVDIYDSRWMNDTRGFHVVESEANIYATFKVAVYGTEADGDFKITRFWMENGVPVFEFSHSTDGAGKSFVTRIKVKGKAELSDGWSDVPGGVAIRHSGSLRLKWHCRKVKHSYHRISQNAVVRLSPRSRQFSYDSSM